MDIPSWIIAEKKSVRKILLSWFAECQRDLPWRGKYDPYQVWIAEIMGQQTQMDRVVLYFARWMKRFPDIATLAQASEQEILKAWEGLGYYTRAKNIRAAAGLIMRHHQGQIPKDLYQLLDLPGIGPYTAAAIASIAFNRPWPLVDANIERFFARFLDLDISVKQAPAGKMLRALSEEMLPKDQARQFNQALMEFGALVCTPKQPSCQLCPLTAYCRSHKEGTVAVRPVTSGKKKIIDRVMVCGIIQNNGLYYIQKRHSDAAWGSLWEFPGGRLKGSETPEEAVRREIFEKTKFSVCRLRPLATVVHHYTKYRATLHGFICSLRKSSKIFVLHASDQYAWVPLSGLADFPFSAGHKKLLTVLFRETQHKNMKK